MILALVPALLGPALAAEQGQLDASLSLFSVLAAIHVGGYDADLDSPANHPLRQALRKHFESRPPAVAGDLRRFFRDHRQANPTAELSQYISFALAVDGPPDFKYRFKNYLLPPDVQRLDGFEKLMVQFHKEAEIDALWQQVQPAFEQAIARYHEPVTRAVTEVNAYLRYVASGALGRRFQIYVDLLGAPNNIQSRSYADDYFVVVTPSPEPQVDDIRYFYLHYLVDPMVARQSEALMKRKALADYAIAAPALEEHYKSDFVLQASTSLIHAIEARLAHPSRRQAMVGQALKQGFILTPHFAEQLPAYEKQERAMRYFVLDMIEAISLKREEQRLENFEFAPSRAVRKAKVVAPQEKAAEPVGVYKTLDEAERLYSARELPRAKEAFLRGLKETGEKRLHAKSYYGLARIAALEKDPELAERLFHKTLECDPDGYTKAWTRVYLGRLSEAAGERDRAAGHYRAALAVEGGSVAARQGAEKGLAGVTKK
ncbi:MAG: tetratricopeptide repeat protein [Acidobacteria bacterium]|nr:tetratricopeptide repeat protein [Acidobacteriota bacterium]